MFRQAGMILALGSILALASAMPAVWAHGTTERVSISSGGVQGNADSRGPDFSADGRVVTFWSDASNLVPGDTNNTVDVFVRDRQTCTTERVSVSSGGTQGNSFSFGPAATSLGGRFVTFYSWASNLVAGDTNGTGDVFVRDRWTDKTQRVSVSSGDAQGNAFSAAPAISSGGRFIAFESIASNLVPGDTNTTTDVFVRDRWTGKTRRVSVSSGGAQGNELSANAAISSGGRFVAFESIASNLVPGYTNTTTDVFVHDRWTGKTRRVSVSSGGTQGNGFSANSAISSGGRFVAFESIASNLVPGDTNDTYDVFVHDRRTGTTERVSVSSGGAQGDDFSIGPAISPDGRFITFYSRASNLVAGDTNGTGDVFVRDRRTGTTRRVSVSSGGAQGNGGSEAPVISLDGRFVAFMSAADNLVPGDTNGRFDVFVRTLAP